MCENIWQPCFGHLICILVVYDHKSVLDKLLPFLRLVVSIFDEVWCFVDLTCLPLNKFLNWLHMWKCQECSQFRLLNRDYF